MHTNLNNGPTKNNLLHKNIVQTSMDGFLLTDSDGNIVEVNEAYCTMSGYAQNELLTMNIAELEAIETKQSTFEHLLQIKEIGKDRFKCQHRTKKGIIFAVEANIQYISFEKGWYVVFIKNITEQTKAEAKLLQNKSRLEYALDNIETGAWELDLVVFDSWRTFKHDQIFGYSEPLEEWTYEMFLEHVVPEDRQYVDQKFKNALANKTDWNFECRIKRIDNGNIRWIWATGNQEFDPSDKPCKMFGIVQDITDKKNAEIKLLDSQNYLSVIFNNTHDAQLLSQHFGKNNFKIVAVNNSYLKAVNFHGLKVSEEDILGKDLKNMLESTLHLSEEVVQYTIDYYQKAIKSSEQIKYAESFKLGDRTYYSETSYTPIFKEEDETSYILYTSHDSTKETEANNRYKKLFSDSPVPLWEEDFTELLAYLNEIKERENKNIRNFFDSNPNEVAKCAEMIKIVDVNDAVLNLHEAENKDKLLDNLNDTFTDKSYSVFKEELIAITEGKNQYESEAQVKTLSGEIKYIYLKLKIDQSQPGIARALLATSDITERKQAEGKILTQLNDLRRWQTVMLNREGRTIELKREVNELLVKAGNPPRYLIDIENDSSHKN